MNRTWIMGLLVAGLSGPVWANGGGGLLPDERPEQGDRVNADSAAAQELVLKIHEVNRREIAIARLARERANSPDVRAYADRLLRDHAFTDRRLERLADQLEVELTDRGAEAGVPAQVSRALGPDFDEIFLKWMREGHRAAMDAMRRLIASVPPDSALGILAARLVPILEQHHTLAIHLQERTGREG